MAHLKSVYPYMIVLVETLNDLELRKKLLNKPTVLTCISEITYNILKKNIKLKESEKNKLRKYKKDLYILANKQGDNKKQKILSGQRGTGLLSLLLSIGIPALISVLANKNASKHK